MPRTVLFTTLIAMIFAAASERVESAQFNPDDTMINRLAKQFHDTMKSSGISGVGQDVMRCYEANLNDKEKTKECVVYDVAALMLDHQMMQLFAARGMTPVPSPMYTNQAFDARNRVYGLPAFGNAAIEKQKVGDAAKRVLDRAFLNPAVP